MENEKIYSFKTARFSVECVVEPEDMDPADAFEFEDDIENVRNGTWEWFQVQVCVRLDGKKIGTSYLGGCAYVKASDFLESGEFHDMVREAVAESRKNIRPAPAMRLAA